MFCSGTGNGIPIPCTAIWQKCTGQLIRSAGSKNPLPLGMGSVNIVLYFGMTSDFKIVAGYFCALREGRELEFLQTQKEKIRHIPEIFEFFRVFTGNSNITEYLPAIMKRAEEGEPITMKTAFATAIEEVRKMQKETEEMQKETEEMQKKAEEMQKEMEKMQKESVKKTKETALKMLSDGMPARKVLEYVEVSPDELRKWQLELKQNERV